MGPGWGSGEGVWGRGAIAGHQTRSGAAGLNVGQARAGERSKVVGREGGDRLRLGVGGAVRVRLRVEVPGWEELRCEL